VAAVLALIATVALPASAQIFTDMTNNPARRAAERLAAKGIVTRLPDGRFAPDEPLNRLDLAVFLGKVIGVPTGGFRQPDFKDIDQVPPGDRAAVAAAATLGTMGQQKVELKRGTVVYTLAVKKASYAPDEQIEVTFTIANQGPGQPTELMSQPGGKWRMKLTEREGVKAGYEGEVYVETKTAQGMTRETVARVRVSDVRTDGSGIEVLEEGKTQMKNGMKAFFLQDVWFEYASTQLYDFIIRDVERNEEIARWSLGRRFQTIDRPLPLAAGKSLGETTRWRQLDQNDQPVRPGRYELVGIHTTKENQTTVVLSYLRGLVSAYPDNTFRPKQAVTRADLAVLMVRALGLEAEAVRRAHETPRIADLAEIPSEARGSIVVAIDRKVVPALPDNTFRPARTATRGEAIFALNVLMESMGRYDFQVGTLREIRGGPPAIIVVEDEKKQIVQYRVAPQSAMYRNDQPVVLQQLRPGDQVKMLKPSDAGLVMYVEATAK
jgi:hypothetical protein